MSRGRPKETPIEPKPTKFTRTYEDEDTITIWKFDLNKFECGPIEVNIQYKAGAEKRIKERAKEAKQAKKTARQMKKLEKNANKKTVRSRSSAK